MTTIIAVLLLVLGYAVGYWSRGTREEIPIVFQGTTGERVNAAESSDLLTDDDLRALTSPASEEPSAAPGGNSLTSPSAPGQTSGSLVASVNGTKYYTPDCAQVARIKEENRVWFESEADARAAGYEASACVSSKRGQ